MPVLSLLAAAAAVTASPVAPARAYDGSVAQSLYIPSFDGVRLAITVHRPARDGRPASERLPVIVTQDRSEPRRTAEMQRFIHQGYVWVAQDRRGTGASFGVQTGFITPADLRDAKAVIEWAVAQPFSSGKAVALGCSNQGEWQYGVVALHPKGLVAVAPACASPQFFDHGVSMNGVPLFHAQPAPYNGGCDRSGTLAPGPAPVVQPVDADPNGRLLAAAEREHRCDATFLGQYWLNMPRDGWDAFARDRPGIDDSPITRAAAIKSSGVAFLQLGGWFDAAPAGELEGQRLWGGQVVLGPWTHGNHVAPGVTMPGADFDLGSETLRWFDHFAKARAAGGEGGVVYYTMNAPAGREWRRTAQWPPAGSASVAYYLDGERLQTAPAATTTSQARPPQPVRWFDGEYQPLARSWAGDMVQADRGSLVRTSAPLADDLELTGTPRADLWVSADAPDANVFAVLEDVGPDGVSRYITDGRLRAAWRKTASPPWDGSAETWHPGGEADLLPLTPGEAAELRFDFFPTSYIVKAGHSVRLALTSSIGEAWQAPPGALGRSVTLTLYAGPGRASRIDLPVVGRQP